MAITLTVMYPNTPGSKFDMDYYLESHTDLVGKLWGGNIISARAVKGIGTPDPDTPAPYQVIAIIEIESLDVLHQLMEQHAEEVMADIPNFTDTEPIIQISENLG